ncbi:MAG: AI-2E family transporter [Syntrophus sp. (in: bacteria)]|nr:AI-2E family transporter [Syntrophus sp. (in: bacteria)]
MDPKKAQSFLFISLLGLVTLAFLYLLKPFFVPLFWAAVIAGIFQPLYDRLLATLKRPNLSAVLMLCLIALIILLPTGFMVRLLVAESMDIYNSISADTGAVEQKVRDAISVLTNHPYMKPFNVDDQFFMEKFRDAIKSIANYIFVHLTDFTQNTLVFLIQFGVMIYALYFFFRDGDRILRRAIRMSFLESGKGKILYEKFVATARATLRVTMLLGGLQGISGGIIFYITGIEGAMIWGLLMVVLAILPGIGCAIIWAPAGIIMLLGGHVWEGVAILTFGVIVISLGDNLLRPMLIGSDVELHPLLIFLSTLGGLVVFGLSGFVMGPIVASLFLAIWDMYDKGSESASTELQS